MRITISKVLASLVGLFVCGYCICYLSPFTVGGIIIVPVVVAMIWIPEFFVDQLPGQIGEKMITASAWGMLILLLVVTTLRWLV